MFRLSKAAEYTIRGLQYLATQPEGKVSYIEEIAKAQDVPPAYLAKLFQDLARKGFVKSYRGIGGGFGLARTPKDTTLLEVIEAMEGPIFLNDCLIHKGFCPRDEVCPVHKIWREAQKKFLEVLRSCTFEDLARSARLKKNGNKFTKR
ncbi:MAG: RrF2 family transcriptional regulator [Deltaproteobacteria bacterium]|nr:RrF2 family transcriptional regulator [Deltaproteobacteria bacterium]